MSRLLPLMESFWPLPLSVILQQFLVYLSFDKLRDRAHEWREFQGTFAELVQVRLWIESNVDAAIKVLAQLCILSHIGKYRLYKLLKGAF